MTVSTTSSTVVAPASQVDTLPKNIGVPAKVFATLNNLNPEALSAAIASDSLESFAKDVATAYQWALTTGARIDEKRTLTGAYVYRAMTLAGHNMTEVAEALSVANSSVTRYRYIARLIFDFGYGPADGSIFSFMANQLVSKSEFVKVLKDDKSTKADIEAKFAEMTAPKVAVTTGANVGGSAEETSSGTDTESRGAQDPKVGTPVPRNNSGILAEVQKLLANLKADTLSPAEWATLSTVHATVETLLDDAPAKVRTAGQKLSAKSE